MSSGAADRHLDAADIERFVIGTLDPDRCERLEQHLAGCAFCGDALATEAAFEMSLCDLWPTLQRRRRPPADVVPLHPHRPATPVRTSRSGLAAVAAALLLLGWWSGDKRSGGGPALDAAQLGIGAGPFSSSLACGREALVCVGPTTSRPAPLGSGPLCVAPVQTTACGPPGATGLLPLSSTVE